MFQFQSSTLRACARASGVLFAVASLAGCATSQPQTSQRDDVLEAAGFTARPADTADRKAMLDRLPSGHFILRTKDGVDVYVYADATRCNCLYVGTAEAYDRYRAHYNAEIARAEDELSGRVYADTSSGWDVWGGWTRAFKPDPAPTYQ